MSTRYTYKKTGVGVVDNLGVQLQKVIRGASQGSLETRYRYVGAAERFLRFVGEKFRLKNLQNIQDKHLEAYAAYMKRNGKADKYIKNEFSGIRYTHRQIPQARYELKDSRVANKDYGFGSTLDGRADRAWTEREVEEMKAKAQELNRPEIVRVLEATRATGMRLDEVASLRHFEVENALRTGILHLTNTKGGKPRDVPLSEKAVNILEVALRESGRGKYAFTPDGMKVHKFERKVQRFIERHRDAIQEPDRKKTAHNLGQEGRGALSHHGLRHTFAREFLIERFKGNLASGMDRQRAEIEARKETSEVMGHGRIQVTFIYAPEGLLGEINIDGN